MASSRAALVPVIKLESDGSDVETTNGRGAGAARQRPHHEHSGKNNQRAHPTTDNIMRLTTSQSDSLSFPERCPVACDFRTDRNNVLEVREGIVRSVSLNADKKRFEYQIEADGGVVSEAVPEDEIGYAIDCPVWIKPRNSSGEEKVGGKILFCGNDGKAGMRYIVQYVKGGGDGVLLRMEDGVTGDRLSWDVNNRVSNVNAQGSEAREGPNVAQEEDLQPSPVVVPISPNCKASSSRTAGLSQQTRLEITGGGSVDEAQSALGDLEEGELEEPGVRDYNLMEQKDGTSNLADSTAKLKKIMAQKPAPSVESVSRMQAETSPLTCDFSDSCVGSPDAAAAVSSIQRQNEKGVMRDTSQTSAAGATTAFPVQHRKISFEPPGFRLRRQKSTASGEGTLGKRRDLTYSTSDSAEEECERPKKLAKTSPTAGRPNPTRSSSHCKKPEGKGLHCELTVPLWMRYGHDDLFGHILGKEDSGALGYRTRKILAKTNCFVRLSRGNPKGGVPMVIAIKENRSKKHHPTPDHWDMNKALMFVEDSLFNFHKERDINGRLRFEMRAGAQGNYLPPQSEGGAVRIIGNHWIKLVEWSSVKSGGIVAASDGRFELSEDLRRSVSHATHCTTEIRVPRGPDGSLDYYCQPYILVHGPEPKKVEMASEMITDANYTL